GGDLDEDADAVAGARVEGRAQGGGDPRQPHLQPVADVGARVKHEKRYAEGLAALDLVSKGHARTLGGRPVGRRQVNEVAVVGEERNAAPRRLGGELSNLAGVPTARRPAAAALGEDLDRLAAIGVGARPDPIEAARDADVCPQLHGGKSPSSLNPRVNPVQSQVGRKPLSRRRVLAISPDLERLRRLVAVLERADAEVDAVLAPAVLEGQIPHRFIFFAWDASLEELERLLPRTRQKAHITAVVPRAPLASLTALLRDHRTNHVLVGGLDPGSEAEL